MALGLRNKLLIYVLSMLVLSCGAISYVNYSMSSTALRHSIEQDAQGSALALSNIIGLLMKTTFDDTESLASRAVIRTFLQSGYPEHDKETIRNLMENLREKHPIYGAMGVIDKYGNLVICTAKEWENNNVVNEPYFTDVEANKPYHTEGAKSKDGKFTLTSSAIITGDNGEKLGVAFIDVDLAKLSELYVQPVKLGAEGYAQIINKQGYNVGHKLADSLLQQSTGAWSYLKDVKDSSGVIHGVYDGKELLYYFQIEPTTGWYVVIHSFSSDVFGAIDKMTNTSILTTAIAVFLCGAVIFFILSSIVSVLNRGVRYATEIAAGNLDAEFNVNRSDELGTLGKALSGIALTLNKIIKVYDKLQQDIAFGELNTHADENEFGGKYSVLVHETNSIIERLRDLIENMPSIVVLLNPDLKITYMNAMAREVAGSDYYGKGCDEMFNRDDYGTPQCALHRAAKTKQSASAETKAHPGGKTLDITYTSMPLLGEKGELNSILQFITDLTNVKESERIILEVAREATDISNRMATASEQLSAQVDEVSRGAQTQYDQASNTAVAMEEMNSTVLEVAKNASQASEQAEHSRIKATDGSEVVKQSIHAIEQVHEVSVALQENMRELGKQAEAIGGVMNVISDIADQTNLLALNAAIEAARAGEAGRGFAVVADEVRKLAENTMNATNEVERSISSIQSAASQNIRQAEDAAKNIDEATRLAASSGTVLQEILDLVNVNFGLIAGIATAAEEQSATSDEINNSVDSISQIAKDTANGMTESSAAVHEVAQMARELRSLLEKLEQVH